VHWLQGEDFDMTENEHLKSISHQHVLAPEMRSPEKAWAVAHKLLHKAAMRLRPEDCGGQDRTGDWVWVPESKGTPAVGSACQRKAGRRS